MNFFGRFRSNETLLTAFALLMLLVPAYAQQEMNPTWYDPWAKPSPAVAAQAKPHKSVQANRQLKNARTAASRRNEARKSSAVATIQPVKSAALRP